MTDENGVDPRRMLLDTLLQAVQDDRYPSVAMLDLIERLLHADELPLYVDVLLDRLRREAYPSIPVLRRLTELV